MALEEKAPYKATITLKGTKPEHIATALQELQYRIAEFDQTGEASATIVIEAHQEAPISSIVEAYETWLFYHAPGLDCEIKLKRPGLRPETRELLAREKRRTPMDAIKGFAERHGVERVGLSSGERTVTLTSETTRNASAMLRDRLGLDGDEPVSSDQPPIA